MIITGRSAEDIAAFAGVEFIAMWPRGIEIDTPRYRELTGILNRMANAGADFVEIAGQRRLQITLTSDDSTLVPTLVPTLDPTFDGALYSFARQG